MQIQVGFEDTVVDSLVKNVCDVNAKNLIQYLKFIRLPILSFYQITIWYRDHPYITSANKLGGWVGSEFFLLKFITNYAILE